MTDAERLVDIRARSAANEAAAHQSGAMGEGDTTFLLRLLDAAADAIRDAWHEGHSTGIHDGHPLTVGQQKFADSDASDSFATISIPATRQQALDRYGPPCERCGHSLRDHESGGRCTLIMCDCNGGKS